MARKQRKAHPKSGDPKTESSASRKYRQGKSFRYSGRIRGPVSEVKYLPMGEDISDE